MSRIVITEDDFAKLVKGEVASKDGVSFILSDIGWMRMHELITEAYQQGLKNAVRTLTGDEE